MNPPVVRPYGGLTVVRDDLLPGGTKVRALVPLMRDVWPEQEFVYGGPAQGYAQVALAYAAAAVGKRATLFLAKRHELHPLSKEAQDAGAKLMQINHGYLSNVQKAARDYAEQNGAKFLAIGFDLPEFVEAMTDAIRSADVPAPPQTWCVAGTGTLARCLQAVWPKAEHHAVQIGFEPNHGDAQLHLAPEKFHQDAKRPPPFDSCINYDAKAWQFIIKHAQPGALFWNVGA